jgi:hypothetical protein
MLGHDDYYEPFYPNEAADVCPGCGAGYSGAHGAYDCGWPSADCPSMLAEMEEADEQDEFWTAGDATYVSVTELAKVSL